MPLTLALLWILADLFGCSRRPDLHYQVIVPGPNCDTVEVVATVTGFGGASLALKGHGHTDLQRVSEFSVTDEAGALLPFSRQDREAHAGARTVALPTFLVNGPIPPVVRYRYRAAVNLRDGNDHIGYSGRHHGYIGTSFGLVTGRSLFILPADADSFGDVTVEFQLPAGWQAVTPWTWDGTRFHTALKDGSAAEHLVAASIGLGVFVTESTRIGSTTYHFAFAGEDSADGAWPHARDALVAMARYLNDALGRSLGPNYTVIAVPATPAGDEAVGEAWATGAGGTLFPLTASRALSFAESILKAYLVYSPYRTTVAGPDEFWVVDGVTQLYARRALRAGGLATEQALDEDLATQFAGLLEVHGTRWSLEAMREAPPSSSRERAILGGAALAVLDKELIEATQGQVNLDGVVRKLMSTAAAPSIWSLLPREFDGPQFRKEYAEDDASRLPVERLALLDATTSAPRDGIGTPTRWLTLAYTGGTASYLENCGCKGNSSGGVARRQTALKEVRRKSPGALILDAGNAFPSESHTAGPDVLSHAELELFLRSVQRMAYDGIALNYYELLYGLPRLEDELDRIPLPYIATNVTATKGSHLLPAVFTRAGHLRVGIVGLFEPPLLTGRRSGWSDRNPDVVAVDPVIRVRDWLGGDGKDADVTIAMGRLSPYTARRIVEQCPQLDVLISTDNEAAVRNRDHRELVVAADVSGFVGNTLVLYPHLASYAVHSARIGFDEAGVVTTAQLSERVLDRGVPEDVQARRSLDDFYAGAFATAGREPAAWHPFAGDAQRERGAYAGAATCQPCHESEYQQWMSTGHAGAYNTLLERHRNWSPRCVACHVVAFGTAGGFQPEHADARLVGVQCEACHGPGKEHGHNPSPENIRRTVPEAVCLECHTPEHSRPFDYEERMTLVRHDNPAPDEQRFAGKGDLAGGAR